MELVGSRSGVWVDKLGTVYRVAALCIVAGGQHGILCANHCGALFGIGILVQRAHNAVAPCRSGGGNSGGYYDVDAGEFDTEVANNR